MAGSPDGVGRPVRSRYVACGYADGADVDGVGTRTVPARSTGGGVAQRQVDPEGGRPSRRVHDVDEPFVGLSHRLGDGEAESGPGHAHLGRGREAVEALEELVALVLGDTRTLVHHPDPGVGVHGVDDHMDPPPTRRELDGIRQEIAQQLVEAGGIAEDQDLVPGVDGEPDARHGGRRLDRMHRLVRQPAQVQLGERHPQPATGAGVSEEVLGDPLELLHVALDRLEHAHLALSELRRRVKQELDEAPDGGDRCPQLVRDRRHDVVLHLGQLAQTVVLFNE